MTIEEAVTRYHERCQLYVLDVHTVLRQSHKVPYRVLEYLAQGDQALTAEDLVAAGLSASRGGTPGTVLRRMQFILRRLVANDLVRRHGEHRTARWDHAQPMNCSRSCCSAWTKLIRPRTTNGSMW